MTQQALLNPQTVIDELKKNDVTHPQRSGLDGRAIRKRRPVPLTGLRCQTISEVRPTRW